MMEQKYTQKEQEYRSRLNKAMKEFVKRKVYSLGHLIENLSIEKPNKTALFFEDLSYSWREFNNECNAYANFFHNLGLEHQNGIAIILENCPEYLFITMGIIKIQGFTSLINTNQRKDALIHAISVADPKYIIIDGKHVPNLTEIHESLSIDKDRIFVINNPEKVPHEFTEIDDDIKRSSRKNPSTTKSSTPDDYIYSIYTSGTTGLPKAVKNKNGVAPAGIYTVSICQLNSEDISYIITPLYHGLAMSLVWTGVVYTGASALLKRRFSSSNFWNDVHKHNVSFLALIGEIPRYLLNQPVSPLEKDHTLKKILSVGLKKMIWMKFKERFQIEHIFEVYTATEAYGPFINVDEIPGMVGRLDLDIHLLLKVNPDTHELLQEEDGSFHLCHPGDVGMLLNEIENPESYKLYTSESATKKKIIKGIKLSGVENNEKIGSKAYLKSGDLFLLHENNWVSFADRLGDTFRWMGENVSTQEVENIIATHKNISLAGVYGVSIPNTDGRAGMAAIVVKQNPKFDISDFLEFLNASLPKYAIPLFLRLCENLDLTGSYKIKKVKLRSEGYDVTKIHDKIFYLDPNQKKYIVLDEEKYKEILNGL